MALIAGVDPVLGEMARLESNPSLPSFLTDQIKNLQLELRFLKTFFWCFAKWDDAVNDALLGASVTHIAVQLRKAGQGLYAAGLVAIQKDQTEKWDIVASNLLERVEIFKPQIAEICLDLLERSPECNFSTNYEILDFINTILENLKHLVISKSIFNGYLKMPIIELEEILRFLSGFVEFAATRAIMYEKVEDFWNHVQGCINKASCVSFLFWVWEMGEPKIDSVLSDLPQKIEPFTPEVTEMYLGVLKASKASRSDTTLVGQVVASFVDSLFKNLQVFMKDYIAVLSEGLMFLLMFLMDPPESCGKLILTQVDAIVSDIASLISSFRVDQIREPQNKFLHELFQRIDKVKAEIKELYVEISDSSLYDFPKTNGLGFLDFLLEKIEEMLKSDADVNTFAKCQIVTIQKELVSLQSLLKLRNAHNELEDIWMQIINVAYRAEHVIDTSLIMDAPIWHGMIHLSDVIEQIKLIKLDFQKMEPKQMKIPVLSDEMNSKIDLPKVAKISSIHVVGLEDDTDRIIERLTRGSPRLEIVSIVGMPGIGKTTLAMKIFYSPCVRCHFHICLWCHVSQVHNRRKSLLNMVESISGHNKFSELNDEGLVYAVHKILRGKRFLIVLDDIWDIEAWHEIRGLFPNDECGSRVLLTSQILNVALQLGCPNILHPLSDEESWKLLKVKVFKNDVCPPKLLGVGKQIAKKCKGLPLAIVLIAEVLARKTKNLNFWRQIALSPNSYIASEGYMDILECSYKHLPDVLRSCFLYFATFQKETVIKVKRLVRLWTAEGFIPKTEGKSPEDLANEYLMDLISRNLVIVDNRCFDEKIKECHVHDLFYYFCVTKGEKEGFIQLLNTSQQYRWCIHTEWNFFVNSKPSGPNVRSLLFHPYSSSNEYPNASDLFSRFKLVRVLDLEILRLGVLFPEELTSLVYLRYLAVAGDFTSIPFSIDNLSYLETLYVRSYDSIIALPNTICKMKRLRDIEIPSGATFSWDDFDVEKSIRLHNVVTFSSLYISHREDAEMLLRMLPRVRRLRFQFYYQFPVLDFLDNLESLNVHKVGRASYSYSYSYTFPSTVRKLTLSNLGLPWDKMSAIAKLPNLQALKLLTRSFEGLCWDMVDDGFQGLRFLKLEGLDISKWNAQDQSLPCLERLVVKNCVKLEEIPYSFGELCCLKTIAVSECRSSVTESARKIAEEQYDMGNDNIRVTITTEVSEEQSSSSGRRSRIKEKMKTLRNLMPNSEMDTVSILDEAIDYLKQLKPRAQFIKGDSENDPSLDDEETQANLYSEEDDVSIEDFGSSSIVDKESEEDEISLAADDHRGINAELLPVGTASKRSLPIAVDISSIVANPSKESSARSSLKTSPLALHLPFEKDPVKRNIKSVYRMDCVPLWGSESIPGKRPEMEDAIRVVPYFMRIPIKMFVGHHMDGNETCGHLTSHFFGVYDGHGGSMVANYCSERIHMALAEELKLLKDDTVDYSLRDAQQMQWEKVFTSCFLKVDEEVGGKVSRAISTENADASSYISEHVAPETVGSTALVAVLCSSHIIVANCGDARAVLCRGKEAVTLSVDHKPNREDEYARIEASGGKIVQWNGHRVFGVLQMSRAIGDRYLKPWIIPNPEVMFLPRAVEDECLILASDGLWNVLSNETACEVARKRILLWHKKNGTNPLPERGQGVDPAAQAAAEYLSMLALQQGSKDNISVIVVDLKARRFVGKLSRGKAADPVPIPVPLLPPPGLSMRSEPLSVQVGPRASPYGKIDEEANLGPIHEISDHEISQCKVL